MPNPCSWMLSVSMLNCNWNSIHIHPGRSCDSFDQLVNKLITHLVPSLERFPGNTCLAQNPPSSTMHVDNLKSQMLLYRHLWAATGEYVVEGVQ